MFFYKLVLIEILECFENLFLSRGNMGDDHSRHTSESYVFILANNLTTSIIASTILSEVKYQYSLNYYSTILSEDIYNS